MFWTGYNIIQAGKNFKIDGDWKNEAWLNEDGTEKQQPLYKPGDRYVVDENGWLKHVEHVGVANVK